MIPKVNQAFQSLQNGVTKVSIGHSDHLLQMIEENGNYGTLLQ
jgi:acetylglutamate kinase